MRMLCFYIILFGLCWNLYGQKNDTRKYEMAISYLRTNPNINAEIRDVFPNLTDKENGFVELNVTRQIVFHGIELFEKLPDSIASGLDASLISTPKLYEMEYQFEPYKIEQLGQVMTNPKSKLFLSFSEPVDNILIAEITTFIPNIRMGKVMQILFVFNQNSMIKGFVFATTHYN